MVGPFTSFNGIKANRVARLDSNGALDATFHLGDGLSVGGSAALQPDGNLLLAGRFINGALRVGVVRIYGDSTLPMLNITRSDASMTLTWLTNALNFQLQESTNLTLTNSWSAVLQTPITNADRISVLVPTTDTHKFFRLTSQ